MATTYEEINIGPFVGGLNSLSDQTSIADTELFQVVNFELDQDGSLVSRPPIRRASATQIPGTAKGVKLIGYFVDSGTQAVYLIASNREGATYYYASGVWTLITSNFAATACTQFRDKLYLVAPLTSANPGGTWTPAGGFVADANMPKGVAIVSNKERLWIVQGKNAPTNGSRVYVTDIVGGVPTWNGNFITVSGGDGQNCVDLVVYNSDLIVFKQSSTWRFAFGDDPAKGYFTNLSSTIGANDTGCYVAYEQQLFVVFNNSVYDFTSYLYNKINTLVPLESDSPSASIVEKVAISAWADRLFVSYFDRLYVYNLRNRTWSTWTSSRVVTFGRILPVPFQQSERPIAYMFSSQPASANGVGTYLYSIVDKIEAGTVGDPATSENFECMFETKNYDYQSASRWKRLRWWGADVDARSTVNVFAQPVMYYSRITWAQAKLRTWGQAKLTTWGRPTEQSYVVADSVSISGITGGKKFVKFLKSLRFRQISYKVTAMTDGIDTNAPVRVYRLTTYVKEKQSVVKKIN